MVQNASALRRKATAGKSGAKGASVKERRMRGVFSDQTPEERERTMHMFMAAMDKNGCRPLTDDTQKHDPRFVEWGKKRFVKAKKFSAAFPYRNDVIEMPGDVLCPKRHRRGKRGWRTSWRSWSPLSSPENISPFSAWLRHLPPCSTQPAFVPKTFSRWMSRDWSTMQRLRESTFGDHRNQSRQRPPRQRPRGFGTDADHPIPGLQLSLF